MICSCSAVSTPMDQSACLVPQSGQMRVLLSSLEAPGAVVGPAAKRADRRPYDVILHSRIPPCIYRRRRSECSCRSKGVVPLQAGPHVKVGGLDGALLMHDVGKGRHRPASACADALVLELDVLLVVEIRGILRSGRGAASSAVVTSQITTGTVPPAHSSIVR